MATGREARERVEELRRKVLQAHRDYRDFEGLLEERAGIVRSRAVGRAVANASDAAFLARNAALAQLAELEQLTDAVRDPTVAHPTQS